MAAKALFPPTGLRKRLKPIKAWYPEPLFTQIYDYHEEFKGTYDRAVDLGTGTAHTARRLLRHFEEVYAVDSDRQVLQGIVDRDAAARRRARKRVTLYHETAERLEGIEDESVDMVTASQAAHYFRYPDVWESIARVLKPGGTVAFWSYPTLLLPPSDKLRHINYKLLSLIHDPQHLGPYQPQPAHQILWSHYTLLPAPPPSSFDLSSLELRHYHGRHFHPTLGIPSSYVPVQVRSLPLMQRLEDVQWPEWEQWMRESSEAFHTLVEKDPQQRWLRREDAVGRVFEVMRAAWAHASGEKDVVLDMPLNLMLVRKRRVGSPVEGERDLPPHIALAAARHGAQAGAGESKTEDLWQPLAQDLSASDEPISEKETPEASNEPIPQEEQPPAEEQANEEQPVSEESRRAAEEVWKDSAEYAEGEKQDRR